MYIKTADRLIELRKKHGYSQEDLANRLNLSRQAISKWERGESSPDTDNLIALAELYQISLDDLVGISKKREVNQEKFKTKKALKIASITFFILSIAFYIVSICVYFGLLRKENLDYKLSINENITPSAAEVVSYVKTNVYLHNELMYKITYQVKDLNSKIITGQSNAVYTLEEAKELVGNYINVRIDGNRIVMVDYTRSVISLVSYIIIGVFTSLATIYLILSIIFIVVVRKNIFD